MTKKFYFWNFAKNKKFAENKEWSQIKMIKISLNNEILLVLNST